MTKSKISLASQASKTNTSNISSSSNLQKSLVHNSTLPNTRNKVFNELFLECMERLLEKHVIYHDDLVSLAKKYKERIICDSYNNKHTLISLDKNKPYYTNYIL